VKIVERQIKLYRKFSATKSAFRKVQCNWKNHLADQEKKREREKAHLSNITEGTSLQTTQSKSVKRNLYHGQIYSNEFDNLE
jgi:hypothetical protein